MLKYTKYFLIYKKMSEILQSWWEKISNYSEYIIIEKAWDIPLGQPVYLSNKESEKESLYRIIKKDELYLLKKDGNPIKEAARPESFEWAQNELWEILNLDLNTETTTISYKNPLQKSNVEIITAKTRRGALTTINIK